ncbi:4Fe-4S binding protein [Candidatus Bathyarchaeota archaeon]|nr:4Fe-4S binding protein [Candidatus Bathyarchaeota archaeon]MBS7628187.1 4Fe-4S binding protein [Candidatus Bathyarchaeota archaeon]
MSTSSLFEKRAWKDLPVAGIIPEPGTSTKYRTGDWRTRKPIIDEQKCTNCLLCWVYCPDAAIERTPKKVMVNYDYCKGCGICANECPVKAITMVMEAI